jgi:heptosyltransferase-2
MTESTDEILIWLPSPMGDAILCTPALRAIRDHLKSSRITFLANKVVREVLCPCEFNDEWIELEESGPIAAARVLKQGNFAKAILMKNSFGSALSVALARVPSRIGYARQGRSLLLTDRLIPARLPDGKFKPTSMVDYYLAIASHLGADVSDRSLSLNIADDDMAGAREKLPEVFDAAGPVVVMVPGGAFGPSKCWPSRRYAETADRLIRDRNATVVISVAPTVSEKQIAGEICSLAKGKLINLARRPVTMGQLKALFSVAELVITNDTGPRHIATAMERKVVTLFGPNDPIWTDIGHEDEIQIVGNVACAPCAKPECTKPKHFCMEAITMEMVCDAASQLLEGKRSEATISVEPRLERESETFFVNPTFREGLDGLELNSIDAIFAFAGGSDLSKSNLAGYRSRMRFDIGSPSRGVFLKRYDKPPVGVQLKNWLSHRGRRSCACCELEPTVELASAGINVPEVVAYGCQWATLFEQRSFIAIGEIPNAEALERKLPDFATERDSPGNESLRRDFIVRLADFVRRFHETGYCHRDLYLSHIFYDKSGQFHLIDLARAFQPSTLSGRWRVKDIAQLHYSSPAGYFSNADRLRFYMAYSKHEGLTAGDKRFLRKVLRKAGRMAQHDDRHGRTVPYRDCVSGNSTAKST